MGSFSIWHWVIVLLVVLAVFGTAKLRNLGGDLGASLKGFKDAMKEGEEEGKKDAASLESKKDGVVAEPVKKNDHEDA